jgi:hypothetical protein
MHKPSSPVSEVELRDLVRAQLACRAQAEGLRLYEELAVERGSARVDLALVGEHLEAFELKSDFDTFGRLHNQIHAYNRVFDQITIITGSVLLDAILEVMPSWWGVWTVKRLADGALVLDEIRRPGANPSQDVRSLASLLWRDEAIRLLEGEVGAQPKKASRATLCDTIAENVGLATLRRHVAKTLVERQAATPRTAHPASAPSDDWSHHDASYLDSHFLV